MRWRAALSLLVAGLSVAAVTPGGNSPGQMTNAPASTGAVERFYAKAVADYGSGASIRPDWYQPGGLGPGIGAFAGHPNNLARSDRVLVRFNLARVLPLSAPAVAQLTATLRFEVARVVGKAATRTLEVTYLADDPWSLTGDDLVKNVAETVGRVEVRKDQVQGREFAVEVTRVVRQGLQQGRKFCAFRFRDVTAEAHGNPELTPAGVEISFQGTGPALEIKNQLTTDDTNGTDHVTPRLGE